MMTMHSKSPAFAATILVIVSFCVATVITADSVQQSVDSADSAEQQNSMTLETNRDQLNIKTLIDPFSKRRSAFLPSRGKKQSAASPSSPSSPISALLSASEDSEYNGDNERMQFLDDLLKDKRGSSAGFMAMRGRKSMEDSFDGEQDSSLYADALERELDALNTIQKRRSQSFMPMRGRKSDKAFPRFYHRVTPFNVVPGPVSSVKTNGGLASGYSQKRKGMGFFGARGKRAAANFAPKA